MKLKDYMSLSNDVSLSRRRFVLGTCASGALLMAGGSVRAQPGPAALESPVLVGPHFNLNIGYQRVNFTGAERIATAVNGSVPGPLLRWKEGQEVTLTVTNHLPHQSSIHWHGIILPAVMDGVPGISFPGIDPGDSYVYRFRVGQSGTYWYHSHSGFQEQTGLLGPIIIEPATPDPIACDRDYVVMLSDWSDEAPEQIFHKLKKLSHYYNFRERTAGDLWQEVQAKGVVQTWRDRQMWNRMRMSDRDISDVTGYTYTFLMNGQTPAAGWTGLFKNGEKIRLRFINGAAMTFFDVRIPGLKMTVVAADGQHVEPVSVDEFRIGVAETYDVIVEPENDTAYTLFAQAIDRTGFARGTLTPNMSVTSEIPAMDAAPVLSHVDMGMNKAGMDTTGAEHSAHNQHTTQSIAGENHPTISNQMPGMDHGTHNMAEPKPAIGSGGAGYGRDVEVRHSATEFGPQVDARAKSARYRLDDPGVGLRDNGRKVLVYADLRNLYATPDPREPEREIELHLTGNMRRYMWSMDGVNFADAQPLPLHLGERVRITLVNDTMMHHPIHLHGMWSDLETGDAKYIPRKHTVVVQPGAKISYLVTVDAPGSWAYHCHLLYHMMGMFREVVVS